MTFSFTLPFDTLVDTDHPLAEDAGVPLIAFHVNHSLLNDKPFQE